MNTRMTVAVALTAGLLGGLLTRYIAPPTAFAQDQIPVTKEIRAQSFTLVDQSARAVGTFTAEPAPGTSRTAIPGPNGQGPSITTTPMRIVLRDSGGREIWSAGAGTKILPLNSYK